MMSAAAGWLADPAGRYQLRFWDGLAWTEHVSTNGVQAVDPLTAPLPAPAAPAGGGWMDRAKAFAQQAADQASAAVDTASDAISKQTSQWQQGSPQPTYPPTLPGYAPATPGQAPVPPDYPTAPPVPGHGEAASTRTRVADQLRRLAELRDEGVFTPEEFEAKRVELGAQLAATEASAQASVSEPAAVAPAPPLPGAPGAPPPN